MKREEETKRERERERERKRKVCREERRGKVAWAYALLAWDQFIGSDDAAALS